MIKNKKRILIKQNQYLLGDFLKNTAKGADAGGLAGGITQIAAGDTAGGIFNTVGSIAEGIPVFGGLIGGALKGIGGIFSMGAQRRKELKEFAAKSAVKQQEAINEATNFNNSVGNKIYPDSLGTNIYSKGGIIKTINPNDDLIKINTGGTHEENPIGGVPVGSDENGTMNTVEQGETIMKDFVYSNRIYLPEDVNLKSEYGLPNSLKGKSFAKASEIINNKFKDREDKTSLETKQIFLDRLANLQEQIKQEEQQANNANTGDLRDDNQEVIESIQNNETMPQNENIEPQKRFEEGGDITNGTLPNILFRSNNGNNIYDYIPRTISRNNSSKTVKNNKYRRPEVNYTLYDKIKTFGPSFNNIASLDTNIPLDLQETRLSNKYIKENNSTKEESISKDDNLKKLEDKLDRSAAGLAIANNLTRLWLNKNPSYAEYSNIMLPQFGTLYPRLTNKARLFNAIDRSARSAEYSLRNLFGNNPGALLSNLGSLYARQLNSKADTALQIEDRDNQIKMGVDQYNNQMAQRNALQNQQSILSSRALYNQAKRDYEDTKSHLIGTLFDNLVEINRDKKNKLFTERLAPMYNNYSMLAGMMPQSITKNRKGGKIKRK